MERPKVVIVGGGFGGLTAAQALRRAEVEILLVDRTNHHLFQPLLYQVAVAALSPGDIASPLRAILRGQRNTRVIMDEAAEIDRDRRLVRLSTEAVPFDWLILAPGSRHSYFGKEEWEPLAPGLKTLVDALEIRERLFMAFERAERILHTPEARKFLTFVVVGGGATGVELAGAIAEIAKKTMLPDFPSLSFDEVSIVLLQGEDRILPTYPPDLSARARALLEGLGVTVKVGTRVTRVEPHGVQAGETFIETVNVIWAAGNAASPLTKTLGTPLDRQGRVLVDPDLSLPDDPAIFVIGDAAACADGRGGTLPGLAPVAMQQARHVARLIRQRTPKDRRSPFAYRDRGSMATIGKARAVAQIGKMTCSGWIAWLLWCFVHILFLIGFRNRFRVMSEWIWYYLTYQPGARILYRALRRPDTASGRRRNEEGPGTRPGAMEGPGTPPGAMEGPGTPPGEVEEP